MSKLKTIDDLLLTPPLSGDMVMISKIVLASSQAVIDFLNIPQNYRHLQITFTGRTDRAATNNDTITLRFNNDSTLGNYDHQYLRGLGSTTEGAESIAGNAATAFFTTAITSPANTAGHGVATIPCYSSTFWQKAFVSQTGFKKDNTTGLINVLVYAGFWRSTSAISRITLISGNGGNLVANTTVTLYGIKGAGQ